MKIKPVRKTNKVVLEFEEFYRLVTEETVNAVVAMTEEYGARRTAYNMWEFENKEKAEEFVFMYRLKYENKS